MFPLCCALVFIPLLVGGCDSGGGTEEVCQDGQIQACTCTDGASGEQTCNDNAWGACECESTCQEGQTQDCVCTDGSSGSQTCVAGAWGTCECLPDCQDGQVKDCVCADGASGSQACIAGAWGDCECIPICQDGQVQNCFCPGGASGTQTCFDAEWGDCECAICQDGQVQGCVCTDGAAGTQTCVDSDWGDCECAPEILMDLAGTFAGKSVSSSISDMPVVGETTSTTTVYIRVEVTQDGNTLTGTGVACFIDMDTGTDLFTTIIPDIFLESLEPTVRTAYLTEGPSGEVLYTSPSVVDLRGVQLDNPFSDPLPTEPDDPRVIDQDNDGHPGMTVSVEGMAIVTGDIYVVQRDISSMEGTALSTDRIEGLAAFDTDMVALDATKPLLMMINDSNPYPDPVAENSYFIFQRIDPQMTCADILDQIDQLF
jgi:hypothetical protein